MKIITHDWNGYGIAQLKEQTAIAKFDVPKGYVNATQMCKANGREWSSYARRKSSKAYWEGLANDLQICISSLIIHVEAYGNEQATWVHPEIAVDLAQWVSVPFKIWANRTLTKIVSGEAIADVQSKVNEIDPASLIAQLNLAAELLADLGIDPNIINQLKLDSVANQLPATKEMLEAGKKLLSTSSAHESVGLTATQVGVKLIPIMKPREVNQLLEKMRLQTHETSNKKKFWQLTESGKAHGFVYFATGKEQQWSGDQIRWQESVVAEIQNYLDSEAV